MTNREITDAIEEFAPLSLQEQWDNSGWQTGDPDAECTGVLICVDVTPEIIDEARREGCNLIVTHHPLLFRGLKQITGRNRPEVCVARAIAAGISVYSSHTAIDCAPLGVSHRDAELLGLTDIEVLDTATGLGAIGNLPASMAWADFGALLKRTFGSVALRASRPAPGCATISRVALCGGSGAEFIPLAIARGAQAYVTADCKLNEFLDHRRDIALFDAGHFETEVCTKELFYRVITEKFPNFAVRKSAEEQNPVICL